MLFNKTQLDLNTLANRGINFIDIEKSMKKQHSKHNSSSAIAGLTKVVKRAANKKFDIGNSIGSSIGAHFSACCFNKPLKLIKCNHPDCIDINVLKKIFSSMLTFYGIPFTFPDHFYDILMSNFKPLN